MSAPTINANAAIFFRNLLMIGSFILSLPLRQTKANVRTLHLVERWDMVTTTIMPSATRNKTSSEPSPRPPEKPKYLSKKSTDFVPKKAARNRNRGEPLRAEVQPASPQMR